MTGSVRSSDAASPETGPSQLPRVSRSEDEVYAATLCGLPGMTPVRLAKVLADHDPMTAWAALSSGRHPADSQHRFTVAARSADPEAVAEQYAHAGVGIHLRGARGYPTPLHHDPGAPAVLFSRGNPAAVEGHARVAIVGTRSATPYGLQVASELGRDLASAGVAVVSGLASGDRRCGSCRCLAFDGGQPAAPVAVVGTGLDVVYPLSNSSLWREVEECGVVFSEAPLGAHPHPRLFPVRNRIIAALSDVVVVVECQLGGGALYTVEAAARRSIPVCAVPGSVRSRASDGTNGLLVDGCTPVRDADDVLTAVALARCGRDSPAPAARAATLMAARGRDRGPGRMSGRTESGPADRSGDRRRRKQPVRQKSTADRGPEGPVQSSVDRS